ncbi:tRNA glutamyl-Q(34) synthetase GluQRS [Pseudoroseicyclus aestuarii]|uniref:Glutamyl-Q tRNA(Asp) synthetase n=1 Tax=Pseudoroseicyclus aestuarii TaxID=1795041 RepID=A0A318TD05_9RHOB|nr:tRNA glutamyl-Q(34) synthetase GluQRS [Pseudoroseicyclus aestuarii]PYE86198.1 glutamyl-Q tRNA(Asp) synthetase [Pseudoroseicyclus aestuarii]
MITRFAPSPTGPLHLGHAFSALTAWDMAQRAGGEMLLRIEDTDRQRSKPEWEALIEIDLAWLGLEWPTPARRQSEHEDDYAEAFDQLVSLGVVYPCSCTRGDIRAALSAPQEGAPVSGPDGIVYPGTCRGRSMASRRDGDALRLDIRQALSVLDGSIAFLETGEGLAPRHECDAQSLIDGTGDVVLGRKETGATSYLLACVWDDALQGVTHVVRGRDLFDATPVQVLLQGLLRLPTPIYHHHRLIRDETGRRLAKRDDARAIARYRDEGVQPADIRRMVGLQPSGAMSSTSAPSRKAL